MPKEPVLSLWCGEKLKPKEKIISNFFLIIFIDSFAKFPAHINCSCLYMHVASVVSLNFVKHIVQGTRHHLFILYYFYSLVMGDQQAINKSHNRIFKVPLNSITKVLELIHTHILIGKYCNIGHWNSVLYSHFHQIQRILSVCIAHYVISVMCYVFSKMTLVVLKLPCCIKRQTFGIFIIIDHFLSKLEKSLTEVKLSSLWSVTSLLE